MKLFIIPSLPRLHLFLIISHIAWFACLRAEDPVLKLPAGAKVLKDIAYVTDGHARQKLDLYLPAAAKGGLLAVIHGGGWRGRSKNTVQDLDWARTSLMLDQGYAVASLGYRLSQDAIFPAQIEDCKAAIRWLRAHAAGHGYDKKRIGVWGVSAGGHLTALLATTGHTRQFDVGENLEQSSAIECGVDFCGPADLSGWKAPGQNPLIQRSGPESYLTLLLGGPIDEKMDLARQASPLVWVTKDAAPLFIVHSTGDPMVGVGQSQRLADKLKAVGVEVSLDVVQGGYHGGPGFFEGDIARRSLEFLNRHLAQP